MTKTNVTTWALGLLICSFVGAFLLNAAKTGTFVFQMDVALSLGGPVFFNTGAVAGIVYFLKRQPSTAMWFWTILLVVTFLVLWIGGVDWGQQRGFSGN